LLAVAALYFWLFIADDLKRGSDMPATEALRAKVRSVQHA
jgi:hypothetical protein